MDAYTFITVLGLSLTGIGAAESIWSNTLTKRSVILKTGETVYFGNAGFMRSMLKQQHSSIVGFIYICLGTLLQIIANIKLITFTISYHYLIFIILAFSGILFPINILNRKKVDSVVDDYFKNKK